MKPLIFALFVLILSSTGTMALAKQFRPENHNAEMNLDEAVLQVKQQTGGRVLSAKTKNKDGRVVHKIKVLLPNGKVRIIRVDAH